MNKVEGSPVHRVSVQERLIRHTLAVAGGALIGVGMTSISIGKVQEGTTIMVAGGFLSGISYSPK